MFSKESIENAETIATKIQFLVDRVNTELSCCHVEDLVIKPFLKNNQIKLDIINIARGDEMSYRELFRGKLYSMILIRLRTRFLNFYRSNGEPLWLFPFYKICKASYPSLAQLFLNLSSVWIVDKSYTDALNISIPEQPCQDEKAH